MTKKIILTVMAGIAILAIADNTYAFRGHGGHGGYHNHGGFHWGIDIGVLIAPPIESPVIICPPRQVIVSPTYVVAQPVTTTVVEERSVVVWVANDNGSRTEVRLVQTAEGGYMGPKGEYYSSMPSQEQLEAMYAVRSQQSKRTNITVWITNDNGSQTPVTLTPSGTGFVGPSNEYYPTMPTEEQLRALYGLRSNAPAENSVVVWLESSIGPDTPIVLTKDGPDYVGPKGEHYASIPTKEQLKMIYGDTPKKIKTSNTVVWLSNSDGSKTPITLQKEGSTYLGPAGEKYASLPSEEQLKLLYGSGANEGQQGELSFEITKNDGSKTIVVLKKEGSEFIGPKGEHYPNMPTEEQLKLIYGK
jgi:hypothetical protein